MAEIKFSQLTTAAQLTNDDIFALAQLQGGSLSSVKTSMIAVANFLNTQVQYTTAYNTQAKTTAGAINELKQLISLIPQFSIEVVQELPTEDISDTTIYLVPAEDPEVGNYYEEYIHVNNTWELVGTTAVDLSAYYTKLEVDGLLATKASVTDVALKENKSDMPTDVRTIIKDCKTPKSATITNGIAQFECIEENLVKALKLTMNPIQDLSHGDPSPTNICPISGRTEVSVVRTGKNLFQTTATTTTSAGVTYTVNDDGTITVSGTATGYSSLTLGVAKVNSSMGNVSITGITNVTNIIWSNIAVRDAENNVLYQVTSGSQTQRFTVDLSQYPDADNIIIAVKRNSNGAVSGTLKPQVELNTIGTGFEPYQGETHTHQYSDTIYGGVDDFVEGGLDNQWRLWTPTSVSTMGGGSGNNIFFRINIPSAYYGINTLTEQNQPISNYFFTDNLGNHSLGGIFITSTGTTVHITFADQTIDTIEKANTYLTNNPLQICYKLATPTTIQTSAEDITTVSGTNIISGTEPISECKYTELATVDDLIKIIGGQ